jgi:hypothetical protein
MMRGGGANELARKGMMIDVQAWLACACGSLAEASAALRPALTGPAN